MRHHQSIDERDLVAYALGLKGQIGTYAAEYARNRAKALLACGDAPGEAVWMRVAEIIESSDRSRVA